MNFIWFNKTTPSLADVRFEIEHFQNDVVKRTLNKIGVNAVDEYGRSALLWAAFSDNIELLKWVIENGADINHRDDIGYSALHFAAQEKRIKIAEYLLENHANAEIKDIHDNTPLWTAVMNARGELSLIQLLLKYGADPESLNKHKRTPREMAEKVMGINLNDML